eukprot:15258576-Alexandrium_andersonii.AAC.1
MQRAAVQRYAMLCDAVRCRAMLCGVRAARACSCSALRVPYSARAVHACSARAVLCNCAHGALWLRAWRS